MFPILIVAGLTLVASFTCSLLEAALYVLTPSRVQVLVDAKRPGARRLARMRDDVEAPIAAILTINTIAHTVGAAWCGAMVGERFGSDAVGLFAAIFTVLVLAVTEIVPKSLGVRYGSRIATWIVWPLQLMTWSVYPIVWVATRSMQLLTGRARQPGPSEDEVVVFADLAARHGDVRQEERRWVVNALRLDQTTAGDLRTPRTVVEYLSEDARVADVARDPAKLVHSRIPVAAPGGDLDTLTGFVYRREVCDAALIDPESDLVLGDLRRDLPVVPETMPAHHLLGVLMRERTHLAAVIDEYGGFEGVVALEDVLERMLGEEIVDEHDEVINLQELARRRAKGPDEAPDSAD